jgi:hypothetical protein
MTDANKVENKLRDRDGNNYVFSDEYAAYTLRSIYTAYASHFGMLSHWWTEACRELYYVDIYITTYINSEIMLYINYVDVTDQLVDARYTDMQQKEKPHKAHIELSESVHVNWAAFSVDMFY